jgi:hypothetical protein
LIFAYRFADKKCPWCGEIIKQISGRAAKRIPRTKAIGNVTIWGLPGTIIKTKSYFWKSPTTVNHALV